MRNDKCLRSIHETASSSRRGAAVVEGAVVISTLFLVLVGMIDMGLMVLQYNTLSAAARKLAREASLHGEMAPPHRTAWGPVTIEGDLGDNSEQAAAISDLFITIDPEEVMLTLEWPDGGNELDQRVRVTLTYQPDPILPLPVLNLTSPLTAVSVMRIAH